MYGRYPTATICRVKQFTQLSRVNIMYAITVSPKRAASLTLLRLISLLFPTVNLGVDTFVCTGKDLR